VSVNHFESRDDRLLDIATRVPGPAGALPLLETMLRDRPSGDVFGWTQNARMGWEPSALLGKEFLILSTHGGIRAADGTPIALGYQAGHWEVGLLMEGTVDADPDQRDDAGPVQTIGVRFVRRSRCSRQPSWDVAPARRPGADASSWEPRPRRRSSAKRSGSPLATLRSHRPVTRSGWTWRSDPRAP
jgi:hypothetical protein